MSTNDDLNHSLLVSPDPFTTNGEDLIHQRENQNFKEHAPTPITCTSARTQMKQPLEVAKTRKVANNILSYFLFIRLVCLINAGSLITRSLAIISFESTITVE
jgi:hypothetical protein